MQNESNFTNALPTQSDSVLPFSKDTIFKLAMYSVIMVVSVVGNCLVILLVFRNPTKRMRTTNNYFIVNMAIGDLLVAILNIPQTMLFLVFGVGWTFAGTAGVIFCKSGPFTFFLSICLSTESLAIIAFDRFLAVRFPFKRIFSTSVIRVTIFFTWFIAAAFNTILLIYTEVRETQQRHICIINFPSKEKQASMYFSAYFGLFIASPLILAVGFYTSIALKLFFRQIPGVQVAANLRLTHRMNRKIVITFTIILAIFAGCWLPFWCALVACLSNKGFGCFPKSFSSLNLFLGLANCALNPCVYFVFNRSYRLEASALFARLKCRLHGPQNLQYRQGGGSTIELLSFKRIERRLENEGKEERPAEELKREK